MRVMFSGASSAQNSHITHGPKLDADLCDACTEKVVNAVQIAINQVKPK